MSDPQIPPRMQNLPRYGAFPIPFSTLTSNDGVPDFRVTDTARWEQCLRQKLCGICGEKLDYWVFFVGGPRSMQSRMFFDPPMHEECARYSLRACPYLAGQKTYSERPLESKALADAHQTRLLEVVKDTSDICLGRTRTFELMQTDQGPLIHAGRFFAIETFPRSPHAAR